MQGIETEIRIGEAIKRIQDMAIHRISNFPEKILCANIILGTLIIVGIKIAILQTKYGENVFICIFSFCITLKSPTG